jgi:TrmH family RNA methyltransferase
LQGIRINRLQFYSISSPANPLIKDLRKAILRGCLTEKGFCAAESFHLLREALRSNRRVEAVIAAEGTRRAIEEQFGDHDLPVALLPDQLFKTIAATETSQGLIALVEPPQWKIEQLFLRNGLLVILDGIQDPGNAGTIVRSAEAFSATGVLFLKRSVNPFNPKTLRASAGSLFRVPFVAGVEPAIARAALQQNRFQLYAAMPQEGERTRPRIMRPCALVIGNEGRGVSEELRSLAIPVSIPTTGVESLNASVAAAILLYEASWE